MGNKFKAKKKNKKTNIFSYTELKPTEAAELVPIVIQHNEMTKPKPSLTEAIGKLSASTSKAAADTSDSYSDALSGGGDDRIADLPIEEILAAVDIWVEENGNLEAIFAYEGFDPVEYRKRFRVDSLRDVSTLIFFVMMRGTKYEKAKNKTSTEGTKAFMGAANRLGLEVGTSRKATVLNLSRLCACFPEICASILTRHPDFVKCPIPNLPSGYQFPQGLSLIPESETKMIESWKIWANGFGALINSRPDEKFWDIQLRSKLFDEGQRQTLAGKLRATEQLTSIERIKAILNIDVVFAKASKYLPGVDGKTTCLERDGKLVFLRTESSVLLLLIRKGSFELSVPTVQVDNSMEISVTNVNMARLMSSNSM